MLIIINNKCMRENDVLFDTDRDDLFVIYYDKEALQVTSRLD